MTYTNSKGWEYIAAIFSYFRNIVYAKEANSHVAPKYIYRGISKRYFTQSNRLDKLIEALENGTKYILDKNDISFEIAQYWETAQSEFKKKTNQENKSYNNKCRKPLNAYTLKDQKKDDKAKELYKILYPKFLEWLNEIFANNISTSNCAIKIADYIQLLDEINNNLLNKLTRPEQIRSGASIRLRDIDCKYQSISDYLNYINNLIYDFKRINPEFNNFSDLEILAEIQHRGGASCLVDFSRNFLISLWFATNNDFDEPGYLFCYNVNEDAISEDNITYLNKDRWDLPVEDLLKYTRKTTQYIGNEKFRFWLWKPANINGRIARQDSVFVFGLEKFNVEKHKVEIITIPPKWKSAIIQTLKTYFGITSESIFPDVDGYAVANNKVSKIDSTSNYLNLNNLNDSWKSQLSKDIIQRGMSCLLNGNYKLALDYFLRTYSEIESSSNKNRKSCTPNDIFNLRLIRLEIIYSIGLCYKKLSDFNSAEFFFNKALTSCYELYKGIKLGSNCELIEGKKDLSNDISSVRRDALNPKFLKIIDDYLEVLYKLKKFSIAKQVVTLLMTDRSIIQNQFMLICTYQRVSLLEELSRPSNDTISIDPFNFEMAEAPIIFKGIYLYYNLVRSVICNPCDVLSPLKIKSHSETKKDHKEFKKFVDKVLKGVIRRKDGDKQSKIQFDSEDSKVVNIVWDFDCIMDSVNKFCGKWEYTDLKLYIVNITSQIKSVIDTIVSRRNV